MKISDSEEKILKYQKLYDFLDGIRAYIFYFKLGFYGGDCFYVPSDVDFTISDYDKKLFEDKIKSIQENIQHEILDYIDNNEYLKGVKYIQKGDLNIKYDVKTLGTSGNMNPIRGSISFNDCTIAKNLNDAHIVGKIKGNLDLGNNGNVDYQALINYIVDDQYDIYLKLDDLKITGTTSYDIINSFIENVKSFSNNGKFIHLGINNYSNNQVNQIVENILLEESNFIKTPIFTPYKKEGSKYYLVYSREFYGNNISISAYNSYTNYFVKNYNITFDDSNNTLSFVSKYSSDKIIAKFEGNKLKKLNVNTKIFNLDFEDKKLIKFNLNIDHDVYGFNVSFDGKLNNNNLFDSFDFTAKMTDFVNIKSTLNNNNLYGKFEIGYFILNYDGNTDYKNIINSLKGNFAFSNKSNFMLNFSGDFDYKKGEFGKLNVKLGSFGNVNLNYTIKMI